MDRQSLILRDDVAKLTALIGSGTSQLLAGIHHGIHISAMNADLPIENIHKMTESPLNITIDNVTNDSASVIIDHVLQSYYVSEENSICAVQLLADVIISAGSFLLDLKKYTNQQLAMPTIIPSNIAIQLESVNFHIPHQYHTIAEEETPNTVCFTLYARIILQISK